uniref:BCL2 interacting protein 3 n=1 Tax=Scophthalmus maximus TaxID=52904 RepID=A0A8D3BE88_SCOMX
MVSIFFAAVMEVCPMCARAPSERPTRARSQPAARAPHSQPITFEINRVASPLLLWKLGSELLRGDFATTATRSRRPKQRRRADTSAMSLQKDSSSDQSLQGSFVELHFSGNGSQSTSHHGSQELDVLKMLLEAQHESGRNSSRGSSQCNSPLRAQTPLLWTGSEANSSQSDDDFQETRREVENLMKKNSDWIWDWSSRPENNPPKEFLLKHPKRSTSLSIRKTSVMKKGGILSADFLKLFLPSLIISHILAVGLGVYIGKRIISHNTY